MNKQNNVKRYAVVMAIGVAINFLFYFISHQFALPMWLDMVGTTYVAMMLEPAAGLLIGLIDNFYIAAFVYDSSSMVYFAVSAAAALIVGINMRKNGKLEIKRIFLTMFYVALATTLVSGILTIWRNNGISDSHWEQYYYNMALSWGLPKYISCFFGIFVLKVYDSLAMTVLLSGLYFLTPKKLITKEAKQIVSWKNKYFTSAEDN